MSSANDPRPTLSAENSAMLSRALGLSNDLQAAKPGADSLLGELKSLLDQCRDGIQRQNPDHTQYRLKEVNHARKYLHYLPDMQNPEATGRLKSVSRRLERAMRTA